MKIKVSTLTFLVIALFSSLFSPQGLADSEPTREHKIKAAFLYNFIKFVEWPSENVSNRTVITIGVIGKSPFDNVFQPILKKHVKDKKVIVRYFESFKLAKKPDKKDSNKQDEIIESLRKCDVLFICSSEKNNLAEIIAALKDSHVLTVSEVEGFLEAGGIINFVMEQNKVRFEISVTNAQKADLEIRSKLLRLAKRVVKDNADDSDNKNKAVISE